MDGTKKERSTPRATMAAGEHDAKKTKQSVRAAEQVRGRGDCGEK
jgi:hypothetical protein